jgi:hypothetical protein
MDSGNTGTAWEARREQFAAKHGNNGFGLTVGMAAQLASWATPTAADHRRGDKPPRPWDRGVPLSQMVAEIQPARLTVSGETLTGSSAEMESGGQLSPEHSRWLMGLPIEWASCAPTETRSLRNVRKPSSKRTSKFKMPWE